MFKYMYNNLCNCLMNKKSMFCNSFFPYYPTSTTGYQYSYCILQAS